MQLIERLQYHIFEYNLNDTRVWTFLNSIYIDEYPGDSSTCEIKGYMRVSFLESLRQSVKGSNGEDRRRNAQGGVGNYDNKERWDLFKQQYALKLIKEGYGCTIQCMSRNDITIYEGNHRIRVAAEEGLYDMPVHLKFFHNCEKQIGNIFNMTKIINNLMKMGYVVQNKKGYLSTVNPEDNSIRLLNISQSTSSKILRG